MHEFPLDYEFIRLKDREKIPALNGWRTDPALTRKQYLDIVANGGNCGVRLRATDLVIDIDPRNGGDDAALGFDIYQFPVVHTPSGGMHVYMRLPEGVEIHHTVNAFGKGIEFKTAGRQVVAPGSIHPNGGVYRWDDFCSTDFTKPVPESLLQRIRKDPVVSLDTAQALSGQWTIEQLKIALGHLDVCQFADNDRWFTLMCACHEATGGRGEDVFTDWSLGDQLYAQEESIIRQRWRSLKSGKGGNAGTGTLLRVLIEHGIDDLGSDFDTFAEEFAGLVEEPSSNGHHPMDNVPGKTALDDLNNRFYVVQEDGRLRILEMRTNQETKILEWIRHTKKDFLEVAQSTYHYPSIEVVNPKDGKVKLVPLAQRWIENPIKGKRVFPGGVVFMPEANQETVGESLNLWRGFAFKPAAGDWSMLYEVLASVLCNNDSESLEYVLNWLARSVQYPHIPAGTACVFKGVKGTGKGTLGRTFAKLFGVHGKHIGSMGAITGRFNIHLRDCVALFADEAYYAGDRAGESILKALITEPTILYEAKGLTPVMGRNCIHIMMASNLDWVVPAGLDYERRFAIFETAEIIRPYEFWKKLNSQLNNGGYAAMLHDLLTRDVSTFDVHSVPQTEALAEQKIESMDIGEQWIFHLLMSGDWGGLPIIEGRIVLAQDLQSSFAQRLGNRKTARAIETQIGVVMRKFFPTAKHVRVNRPNERLDIATSRPWAYELPPYEEAKIKFIKMLGRDVFE